MGLKNSQKSNKTSITGEDNNSNHQSNNTHLLCLVKVLTLIDYLILYLVGDTDSETPAEVVEEGASLAKSERSHLVVWQVAINQSSNQKTQY